MGAERFLTSTYDSYVSTNNLARASRREVFTSSSVPQALDPRKITLRESCDSAANPSSTPIILGLDVTGSMGFVAEAIAKDGLPKLMEQIYEELPVTDPHLLFMGIGDVACDRGPLQVSQFEAGALPLIEQLRQLWLEGGGGGNNTESYNLPWYFAAHFTKIDSFDKRGQKGYIFTIGDEMPPTDLSTDDVRHVFGSGQRPAPGGNEELLRAAGERYKVFHIIAEEGSYARGHGSQVETAWAALLGPNVILMRDKNHLADIVVATLQIAEGADIERVISDSNAPAELRHAFKHALNSGQ